MRMCWSTILVKNMEESLTFYRDVLELKVNRNYKTPEGLDIYFLSDGMMSEVELIHNPHVPPYEGRGICLGFEVPSLQACMDRFKELGIEILKGPITTPSGLRFFYIQDPDGVEIQLVEPLK